LTKFIQNPQPFIDGSVKVVDIGTEKIVKPVATEIAAGVGKSTNWTVVILALVSAGLILMLFVSWRWRRRHQVAAAAQPHQPAIAARDHL